MKRDWVVSSAIADHYDVVNTHLPILYSPIGKMDLRKITLEEADALYERGTIYLRKKPAKRRSNKKA